MHIMFAIFISITKLTGKPTDVLQADFCDAPSVSPLQNYKATAKEVSGWKQCNREIERVIEVIELSVGNRA